MTKQEAMRQTQQQNVLMALGFTQDETEKLRRISMTLHRWHERECGDGNGYIERDEKSGKPVYVNCNSRYLSANDPRARHVIADREAGAIKRLIGILTQRNKREWHPINPAPLESYIQGDPRGAALYILRPGDVPEGGSADAYYSRGVCVY